MVDPRPDAPRTPDPVEEPRLPLEDSENALREPGPERVDTEVDGATDADGEAETEDDAVLEGDDHDVAEDDQDDSDDPTEGFGEGIARRPDEADVTNRAVWLSVAGLLAAAAAVVGLIAWLAPDPAPADSRDPVKDLALTKGPQLLDLHDQQLDEVIGPDGDRPEPVKTVVCGIEDGRGDRQQRCELRVTTFVSPERITQGMDRPVASCTPTELPLYDDPPLLTTVPLVGCVPSPALVWMADPHGPRVGPYASWVQSGQVPARGTRLVAISTRLDLGTFGVGTCPSDHCTPDQVQLPRSDYKGQAATPSPAARPQG